MPLGRVEVRFQRRGDTGKKPCCVCGQQLPNGSNKALSFEPNSVGVEGTACLPKSQDADSQGGQCEVVPLATFGVFGQFGDNLRFTDGQRQVKSFEWRFQSDNLVHVSLRGARRPSSSMTRA